MRLTQLLARAAQIQPHGGGTRHHGRDHAWPEVLHRARRLAAGLIRLGLAPGDRVALLAANGDRFLETTFAVAWAGGVLQPVNLRLAGAEVAEQFADAGTRVAVFDEAGQTLLQTADAALPADLPRLFIGEAAPPGALAYDTWLGLAEPGEASSRGSDDLAALIYTGGTTGRPKGVMLSHRNLVVSALSLAHAQREEQGDVVLFAFPLFHVAGFVGMLKSTLTCATCLFLPRFDALAFLETVAREHVTRVGMAPTMLRMVLEHPDFGSFDLSSLTALTYGASPIPESVVETAIARLPHVGLMQGYGQTESASGFTLLPPRNHVLAGPHAGRLRSAGYANAASEVAILDPRGRPLPAGEVGEICVRGDHVMLGYWNRPDETAAALAGGWLHTGDLGCLDQDGFVFIVDRLKDMVVTGGENVFTAEVESALSRHPAVAECAVIGVPDARWGERVHAVVRLRDGAAADAAALIAHCAGLIARYKCPKSVEFRNDPLPLSAVGKVLKTLLRAPHWQGQGRRIG
ncbi:AMP-binding protein [Elioraea sp.]|uniref:AMP-binding protein n=1 Tax=Elioraea sp. TaxID=2185103 RepID=UPI003F71313D